MLRDKFIALNVYIKKGISLVVQQLRFCASNAGGTGSIPGWRIDPTSHEAKKKKKKRKRKNLQINNLTSNLPAKNTGGRKERNKS